MWEVSYPTYGVLAFTDVYTVGWRLIVLCPVKDNT